MNIQDRLGCIAPFGFVYKPSGKFTQKSVAADTLQPLGPYGAWQMLADTDSKATALLASKFHADLQNGILDVTMEDPISGAYHVRLNTDASSTTASALTVEKYQGDRSASSSSTITTTNTEHTF